MAGLLGVGNWQPFLTDRGGGSPIDLAWTDISLGRTLSETSQASVTVPVPDAPPQLASARPWQYELALHRDGRPEWFGPVVRPVFRRGTVTLGARDLTAWWERRSPSRDLRFDRRDLAEVFKAVADDAMARDPSPAITTSVVGLSGTPATRQYSRRDARRTADLLRELARSGLEWTAVGRVVHVGPRASDSTLPVLVDEHADFPEFDGDGVSWSTEDTVIGGRVGDGQVVATVGGTNADLGLLQTTHQEPEIRDRDSAAAAAARNVALRASPLSTGLDPEAPVDFADLVPGSRWPLRLLVGVREVHDSAVLASVSVTVRSGDQGVAEDVRVVLAGVTV